MKKKLVMSCFVLIIAAVFLYSFIGTSPLEHETSLTGFVVIESGVKVSTEKLDSSLIKAIQEGDSSPRVMVLLDSTGSSVLQTEQNVVTSLDSSFDVRVEGNAQKSIVDTAEPKEESLHTQSTAEEDITVVHAFESISALSLDVESPEALLALTKDKRVSKIMLDYPVLLSLDDSVALARANAVWNLSSRGAGFTGVDNRTVTGKGNSVCVIDTGVDYTHRALGDCHIVSYNVTGVVENISVVESTHPYANNIDYTWKIQKEGFSSIAIHFANISLESQSGGDTTDRIYVYDRENNTLAVYKGELRDVWTPHALGDTLYVRLVSDSSVNQFGFVADSVLNGTTNSTLHWEDCSVVIGGYDTFNGDSDPMDDHGHGTHVAGIIASQNDTYRGVAPGATVVALKALSAQGGGYSSDVLSALEWCYSNSERLNISVISMSLGCDGAGCPHYGGYCDNDILSDVINRSVAQNISVFIASGNSGWSDGISNPSCIQNAIPIGGETVAGGIMFNRGGVLQIIAPGQHVRSPVPGNSFATWSGTSMATPHAAAVATLMQQYSQDVYGRELTPQEIESRLSSTPNVTYDVASLKNYTLLDGFSATIPQVTVQNVSVVIAGSSLDVNVSSSENISYVTLYVFSPNATSMVNDTQDVNLSNAVPRVSSVQNGRLHHFSIGIEQTGRGWYVARYTDLANNSFRSPTYFFESALASSRITLFSPLNGSYISNMLNVSGVIAVHNQSQVNISLIRVSSQNVSQDGGTLNSSRIYSTTSNESTNLTIAFEYNVSGLLDGNYTVLSSLDEVGSQASVNRSIVIDRVAPHLEGVVVSVNSSIVSVVVNASDFNLDYVVLEKPSTSSNKSNFSMNLLGGGQFGLTFFASAGLTNYTLYAVDYAGNVNSTTGNYSVAESQSFAHILSPAQNATFGIGEMVSIDAYVNSTVPFSYQVLFGDETMYQNVSNVSQIHIEKTYGIPGNYTITILANSSVGSGNATRAIFIRDLLAPRVQLTSVPIPIHTGRDTQIGFEITDRNDILAVEMRIDDTPQVLDCSKSIGLWACTMPVPSISAGDHEFSWFVRDAFLNENVSTRLIPIETCSDGLQNGDEVGSDCGGSCAACPTSTPVAIQQAAAAPVLSESEVVENSSAPSALLNLSDDTHVASSRASTQQSLLYVLVFVIALLVFLYALLYRP